ncbi:MAG TPA: hypothetical protein PKY05_00270 [Fibrobacteria bacterium]|nr:hypothetical protein [Fibrobacteria bacterium]
MSLRSSVELEINGQILSQVERLEVTCDLYKPSGSFSATIGLDARVEEASLVRIYLDGLPTLVGIIDQIDESYDKNSHNRSISGRSLIGLVEDTFVTSFGMPPSTIKDAAQKYLAKIPHVSRFGMELAPEASQSIAGRSMVDVGDTVFKVLSGLASSIGLIFWCAPDGRMTFGKLVSSGASSYRLDRSVIQRGQRGRGNGKIHSKFILISDNEEEGHRKVEVVNPTAPLERPFVAAFNGHSSDIKKQAQEYLRQERIQALQLEYEVAGFSQGGTVWAVNRLVDLVDDILCLEGTYILHRCAFSFDRRSGSRTRLSLSPRVGDPFKPAKTKKKAKQEVDL